MGTIIVEEPSATALPLIPSFQGQELAHATGFLWRENGTLFLITNWHVITGKNPITGENNGSNGGLPDKIDVCWCTNKLNQRFRVGYDIYDSEGKAKWLVHPQLGNLVDVIALPLSGPSEALIKPVNELAETDIKVRAGGDAFVLGFPFKNGLTSFPIWKRGSIASEPYAFTDDRRYIFLDTASRPGMSGSPVLLMEMGQAMLSSGTLTILPQLMVKFLGVYSGRFKGPDTGEIELGMVWQSNYIGEIISSATRDSYTSPF